MNKRAISILFAIIIICIAAVIPVNAQEHSMEHGSSSKASVSEEVDRASGGDNDMATQYFMYIPTATYIKDVPKMGDSGIDINMLLLITIGTGITYLGCHYYAYKDS